MKLYFVDFTPNMTFTLNFISKLIFISMHLNINHLTFNLLLTSKISFTKLIHSKSNFLLQNQAHTYI